MAKIALKVDVDTLRGTKEGVPNLARTFERFGLNADTAALLRAETATGGGTEYCADEDGENPELDALIADFERVLAEGASL